MYPLVKQPDYAHSTMSVQLTLNMDDADSAKLSTTDRDLGQLQVEEG